MCFSAEPATHELLSFSAAGRRHEENQDRVLARIVEWSPGPLYLIAVADGVSQCSFGGSVANYIVERHLARDTIFRQGQGAPAVQLKQYLRQLNDGFYAEFSELDEMMASGATLSVALLQEDAADCFWAGDSPIYWSRPSSHGYLTRQISVPDRKGSLLSDNFGAHAPFALKHEQVAIGPGDIVTIASDGVVHDAESLSEGYARLGFSEELLLEIKDIANRSRFSDDISVSACRRKGSGQRTEPRPL
jgi:serine/threonine protein phosphatase PrpC